MSQAMQPREHGELGACSRRALQTDMQLHLAERVTETCARFTRWSSVDSIAAPSRHATKGAMVAGCLGRDDYRP